MIKPIFLEIIGILGSVIVLYLGLKLSKHQSKKIKIIGYILIVIGLLGLLIDLYKVINEYIIPGIIIK